MHHGPNTCTASEVTRDECTTAQKRAQGNKGRRTGDQGQVQPQQLTAEGERALVVELCCATSHTPIPTPPTEDSGGGRGGGRCGMALRAQEGCKNRELGQGGGAALATPSGAPPHPQLKSAIWPPSDGLPGAPSHPVTLQRVMASSAPHSPPSHPHSPSHTRNAQPTRPPTLTLPPTCPSGNQRNSLTCTSCSASARPTTHAWRAAGAKSVAWSAVDPTQSAKSCSSWRGLRGTRKLPISTCSLCAAGSHGRSQVSRRGGPH